MEILYLLVGRDDGVIKPYFGIEYENKLWLVTSWLINLETQKATPERMIRVDALDPPAQKCDPGDEFDYTNIRLPKDVIEGVSQDIPGYEVRSLPDSPVVDRHQIKFLPQFPRT